MIIPVRCLSCGKPVGHLWEEFKEKVAKGEDRKKLLHSILGHIDVNLRSIESRPSKSEKDRYLFYLEMDGHKYDKDLSKSIIDIINRENHLVKILGSYPHIDYNNKT